MRTAAIIVNYNDGENLIQLVKRMSSYETIDDIIVVDNNSTDGSSDAVKDINKVHIIYSGHNGGYGFGNNQGIRFAHEQLNADYGLIMNPDAEITEDAVKAMLSALTKDPEAAVCAPVCITPESTFAAPVSAWPIRAWHLELFEHCPLMRRIFAKKINYPSDYLEGKGCCEVGAVLGSCLMTDLQKMTEVGGYDENIFLYCEENIIGFKMKKNAYRTLLLRDVSYIHNHKPSLPSADSMRRLRESELYYFKNYLKAGRFKMLISRIFLRIAEFEVRIVSPSVRPA